ncbi:hypothetical protein [Clostridium magnum]|uniref:Uncharacterized protein n=1 Tax=Clostridium magnum DSM 2767 TaxID=1121326 RepID=A0A161WPZ6_9CLOT|nr:hypothetical protein [Clostridium magnum]KZL88658.1 hypothetical protein CLMAG_59470 [Clostridium magnum DSM 2767]KZL88748.1 hypothetical protein CLMAG_60370 [Clostridium magnum DSM 2767]SHJ68499.1 hypothetical protein SAMN02745944_06330 [Clostridium magnum DSM 2767]
MKNYNIVFNSQELDKFNTLENQKNKDSVMSIYSYLLKLNNTTNAKYEKAGLSHLKEATKLSISMRDFIEKYKRCHPKMSIRTLKKRIDLLIELGLIAVEKFKNSFTYSFFRYMVNESVNKNVNTSEVVEPIENTVLPCDDEKHKYLNSERVSIDLDSNTCSPRTPDNFEYENYVQDQEKVTSWEYISPVIEKLFITMKVKSSWIKGHVIDKLFNNYSNITKKHAVAYVIKAITNARIQSKSNYKKYVINNKTTNEGRTTYSRFNDFPQRNYTSEDLKNIERALLGW